MKKQTIRQGDVMIILNAGETQKNEVKDRVIAEGEGHGHVHLTETGTLTRSDDGSSMCLELEEDTMLRHTFRGSRKIADHNPLVIPAGKHMIVIQREFDPYAKAVNQVRD